MTEDDKIYTVKYDNFDAIIAVGCPANSYQATRFRDYISDFYREIKRLEVLR